MGGGRGGGQITISRLLSIIRSRGKNKSAGKSEKRRAVAQHSAKTRATTRSKTPSRIKREKSPQRRLWRMTCTRNEHSVAHNSGKNSISANIA